MKTLKSVSFGPGSTNWYIQCSQSYVKNISNSTHLLCTAKKVSAAKKNAAMISAISVVLVCGQFQNNIDDTGVLKIGPWKIQIDPTAVSIISAVRTRFDELIRDVLSNNETYNISHEEGREIAAFVVDMIEI